MGKIRAKQILLDNSIGNKVQGVQKEFNFPFSTYEEIYDSYYKKGAEVNA